MRPPAAVISSSISSSCSAEPVPSRPGRRQMRGDVEDARLRVLERRTDVDAAPPRSLSSSSTASVPRPRPSRRTCRRWSASPRSAPSSSARTACRATARPPTAAPPAATGRARCRGCPRDRARPRRCGRRSAGPNDVRMRDAVSLMSVSAVTASARAAPPSGRRATCRWPSGPRRRRRAARSGRWPSRRRGGRSGPGWRRGSPRRTSPTRPRAVARVRVRRAGRRADGDAERRRRQLGGGHAGHPVDEFVRLVDDEQVVLGQHRGVGDGVDGQQRVVGDDDVGQCRPWRGPSRRSSRCRTGSGPRRCIPAPTR